MTPIAVLHQDIRDRAGQDALDDWHRIKPKLTECAHPAKAVIMSAAHLADRMVFVSDGIVASEQVYPDAAAGIARFFERGHFCTNLTSAWRRDLGDDTLVAITAMQGVIVPLDVFMQEYLHGSAFGLYLRLKAMDALAFDKEVMCAKTLTGSEARYRFLEAQHDQVIAQVPAKDIARFMGMTPQGLSRFLRHRATS